MTKDALKPTNLEALDPKSLAEVGLESPADLDYRIAVVERLSKQSTCPRLVLFDDVAYAVPEAQRPRLKGLPGYERALLPGLLLAAGFEQTAVLVAAPPNPVEREIVLDLKRRLEEKLGRKVNFQIIFDWQGQLVDLSQINEEQYYNLCQQYAQGLDNPEELQKYNEDYHLNVIQRYRKFFGGDDEKTLVVPFQTTPTHYEILSPLINEGRMSLPSIPQMDKVLNNFRLKEASLEEVIPEIIAVSPSGQLFTTLDELVENFSKETFEATEENITKWATGIITALKFLKEKGKKGYIKLDSNGVSGLGNLPPSRFPDIYDFSKTEKERLSALIEIIKGYGFENLPRLSAVEELVDPEIQEGVKKDITVGGMMINGQFFPMSIFPFGVDKGDEYVCGWMSADSSKIGIDSALQKRLFEAFSKMGQVLAQYGYTDGVLAGDVMVGKDGKIYIHDYNFRRGGRSYLEALIALMPEVGLFEAQISFELPFATNNSTRFGLYTQIAESLYEKYGIIPFSTSFGYFGGHHDDQKPDFLKFKLAVPIGLLANLERSKHLSYVETLVMKELMRLSVEIKTEDNVWPPYSAYDLAANCYPRITELSKRGYLNCCDIGTGSGVLAVLGGKWFPGSRWVITDLNQKAVEQAVNNWQNNGLPEKDIQALVGDGISEELIEQARKIGGFDLLVGNLPQQPLVDAEELDVLEQERQHNPAAWNIDPTNDPDGLGIFISVLKNSSKIMREGGIGLFSVSSKQNEEKWKTFLNQLVNEGRIKFWEIISSEIYPIPDSYDQKLIEHWLKMEQQDSVKRIFQREDGKWYYVHYNLLINY